MRSHKISDRVNVIFTSKEEETSLCILKALLKPRFHGKRGEVGVNKEEIPICEDDIWWSQDIQ